jgi:acetoin utilization protein AcuB
MTIKTGTMNARQLIQKDLIPLKPEDTGTIALSIMDELRVEHLPVVRDSEYLSLIAESDIYSLGNIDEPIGNQKLPLNRPFVLENQHIYEAITLISSLKLSLLPVLDESNAYLGSIGAIQLLSSFSGLIGIENPGGIIVLEMGEKDYLLTEIAQIVESNDAKILNVFITTSPDPAKMEVTLKVNRIDVGPILKTFSRYNYVVKASYSEDTFHEGLQDRYDSLMNYLNV